MVNIAIFASGNGSNFESIVRYFQHHIESKAVIKCLVVDNQAAFALKRAELLAIPSSFFDPHVFSNKEEYEQSINEYLSEFDIDCIVLAGYMRFIGSVLLKSFPQRIINLHPAYLPAFPGAHSIREAYDAKVEYSGVTIHYVDEGIDSGKIITQQKVELDPNASFEAFETAIHQVEYEIYAPTIAKVCKLIEEEKQ